MNKIYFTLKEVNPKGHVLTDEQKANLEDLIQKLSIIREAYGQPMIVTSGFRSREDQERIYGNASKVPYGSQHLNGCAADVFDRDKSLAGWCFANYKKLEEVGLWCEDPTVTRNWVHFQTRPPQSGTRFFKP